MSQDKWLVLIIEDEAPIRRFLRAALEAAGMRCLEAGDARQGLALAASQQPDLVLLDLGLPDRDGLEVIKNLRQWSQTPIIVISARDKERDKIDGLDAGADDYLTKPFGVGELNARIRAALRRVASPAEGQAPVFEAPGLKVDLERRQVWRQGQEVHLTPIEFKLLAYLARNAGKVVTHGQLLRAVWGTASPEQSHYPRLYVHQLRHKLEPDPARPVYLRTEPGVGYRLLDGD
ncbi:MAG: response regulator [Desulfarculus sp.]|nr:response regulator [Desulfarculus sp.]